MSMISSCREPSSSEVRNSYAFAEILDASSLENGSRTKCSTTVGMSNSLNLVAKLSLNLFTNSDIVGVTLALADDLIKSRSVGKWSILSVKSEEKRVSLFTNAVSFSMRSTSFIL